jgi:DNA primase
MNIDIQDVLDELGVEVVRQDSSERDPWAICLCPFHDDTHPSFAVALKTGHWVCYAGCGVGTLTQLAARLRGLDEYEAARWLAGFGGRVPVMDELLALLKPREVERPEPPAELPPYERGRTHKLMQERGFTFETLRDFGVGWDRAERAVVLPIVFRGATWGLAYKYVDKGHEPPYRYTPGLPKGGLLFGWDMLPDEVAEVVVTEGPLDAMWLHQCHFPGVALLGADMSAAQAELLARRTRAVVLALDSDEAGQRGPGTIRDNRRAPVAERHHLHPLCLRRARRRASRRARSEKSTPVTE